MKTIVLMTVITGMLLGFQSPSFSAQKEPPERVKICDIEGGAQTTCTALEECLLSGGEAVTDDWGDAMCCPENYPAEGAFCTGMTTVGSVIPTPKPPSLRDQMKPQATTSAPAKAVDNPADKPVIKQQQMKVSPTSSDKALSK